MKRPGFIQRAAEGKNDWYFYLITVFLIIIANFIASLPVAIMIAMSDDPMAAANLESINPEALGVHPSLGLALLILPFALSIPAIWLGLKSFHKRPFLSIINPFDKIDWSRFFFSFALWFILMVGFEFAAYLIEPDNYTFTFDLWKFLPTFLVVLIFIPLQTSMEELLFRGYLLQGFGLWFKRPWVTILITSIAFGMMHIANPEIDEFGTWILTYYIGFGLIMAVMTVMDEGLELALGVHAANNIFGASFVTFTGSALQTPTLFTVKEYNVELMTIIWLIASIIFLWVISKRYKWSNWNKLFEKIDIQPQVSENQLDVESDTTAEDNLS